MATEVATGVWWLDLGSVNVYLLEDGEDLVLVDAGMPRHAGAIRQGVRETGHDLTAVDRVLLTHYDYDHVGGLSKLEPALDAPVYAREPDASFLTGERRPPLTNRKGLLQRVTRPFLDVPDLPVRRVTGDDEVGSFTAYATPGHTPGHTAFVSEDRDAALLGDMVRSADGGLSPSPWYISYDRTQVRQSIRVLMKRAPSFAVACPGHGEPLAERGSEELSKLA